MTALYPSREDAELNARALKALAEDKKNESNSLMDGAWTGHPDQNEIAVSQFPVPNQLQARALDSNKHPELRPLPRGPANTRLQARVRRFERSFATAMECSTGKARACSMATWKIWPPTAFTG